MTPPPVVRPTPPSDPTRPAPAVRHSVTRRGASAVGMIASLGLLAGCSILPFGNGPKGLVLDYLDAIIAGDVESAFGMHADAEEYLAERVHAFYLPKSLAASSTTVKAGTITATQDSPTGVDVSVELTLKDGSTQHRTLALTETDESLRVDSGILGTVDLVAPDSVELPEIEIEGHPAQTERIASPLAASGSVDGAALVLPPGEFEAQMPTAGTYIGFGMDSESIGDTATLTVDLDGRVTPTPGAEIPPHPSSTQIELTYGVTPALAPDVVTEMDAHIDECLRSTDTVPLVANDSPEFLTVEPDSFELDWSAVNVKTPAEAAAAG